ncbi:YibE/F family protein [Lacticaseibacillus porcinae]|uniref:YibE/F family protein n=1 Tax=Lacticaseibacillus porcinae TaxID=1123687 RepID=UPI000F7ACD90|nr:YibE/F family protein [Lacticaseibacillus porcinae]
MNAMVGLVIALLILMLLVGGRQGLSNFLALAINTFLMILAVVLMAGGFSPVAVAFVIGLLVLATTIFMSTSHLEVAGPAFVASLMVMAGVLLVVFLGVWLSQTSGFGQEDSEELEGFSVYIGVSFQQLMIATGLLGTLGAIAEAACAVAAGVIELGDAATVSGLREIETTIIGTAMNTLFFGFFGGFSALFIWFAQLKYPLWQILNNQIFVGELLQVLFSVIAVILTVPMTIWIVRRRQTGRRS